MTGDPPDAPLISVTMTAVAGGPGVDERIEELLRLACPVPWELVVSLKVGGSGAGADPAGAVPEERPGLRVVTTTAHGIPAGRNAAVEASRGAFVLACDVDDTSDPGWLAAMAADLAAADVDADADVDLVAGRIVIGPPGTSVSAEAALALTRYPYGYLPYGLTANLGFRRDVFDRIGGFDERMLYGDDVDFCWRAQEAGFTLVAGAGVVVKHPRDRARDRLRQHFRFGTTDVLLYRVHRRQGMRRRVGMALKTYAWLVLNVWRLAADGRGRSQWAGVAGQRAGRLYGLWEHRAFYP